MKLFFNALIKFLSGVILVGALVFLPAGTLRFFGGWLFMALMFVASIMVKRTAKENEISSK
jgi:hypothetical protein